MEHDIRKVNSLLVSILQTAGIAQNEIEERRKVWFFTILFRTLKRYEAEKILTPDDATAMRPRLTDKNISWDEIGVMAEELAQRKTTEQALKAKEIANEEASAVYAGIAKAILNSLPESHQKQYSAKISELLLN